MGYWSGIPYLHLLLLRPADRCILVRPTLLQHASTRAQKGAQNSLGRLKSSHWTRCEIKLSSQQLRARAACHSWSFPLSPWVLVYRYTCTSNGSYELTYQNSQTLNIAFDWLGYTVGSVALVMAILAFRWDIGLCFSVASAVMTCADLCFLLNLCCLPVSL